MIVDELAYFGLGVSRETVVKALYYSVLQGQLPMKNSPPSLQLSTKDSIVPVIFHLFR